MYVCIIMHVCMCLCICVYDFMGIYVHAWVFVALNMCVHCALQSLQLHINQLHNGQAGET